MKTEIIYDTKGNPHEFHLAETYDEKQEAQKRANADPDFYDGFSLMRRNEARRKRKGKS